MKTEEMLMATCRVILELSEGGAALMRWQRTGSGESAGMFLLLGRAFEIAQREAGGSFQEAVEAFMKGALIQREDLAEVLKGMEEK